MSLRIYRSSIPSQKPNGALTIILLQPIATENELFRQNENNFRPLQLVTVHNLNKNVKKY
jgi:hypothetical protein